MTSPIISDALLSAANAFAPGSISPTSNGQRKISGELLSPTDSGYGSASSTSFTIATTPSLDVPINLESVDTMVWIGFEKATGDRILNDYMTDIDGQSLQRHIENHLRYSDTIERHDWYKAMTQLGISAEMQQAVMAPEFDFVRSWNPLRHWLEEFIIGNLLSLITMDGRIRGNIEKSQSELPHLRGGAGDKSDNYRADYELKRPGYTTLYHATTAGRLKDVFLDGGKVNLAATMSRPEPASDFGYQGRGTLYYWTPDTWVVDLYAEYCRRAVKNQYDVCMLKLSARSYDIETSNKTWRLSYGDEWRRLIWHSRTATPYPEEISERHRSTNLFIGPLSVNATSDFKAMSSWTDVTEDNVCKSRCERNLGAQAIQYAVQWPETMVKLATKAEVDLFRFYGSGAWLADPKTWVAGR